MDDHSFLGQGWAFPPEFSLKDGAAILVRGQADIAQSLQILLSTQLGERVMHPDFGCSLQQFVFEKVNTTTITYLRDTIETAILYHEPRIMVEQVNVAQRVQDGVLMFEIIYVISATNTRSNFVFFRFISLRPPAGLSIRKHEPGNQPERQIAACPFTMDGFLPR